MDIERIRNIPAIIVLSVLLIMFSQTITGQNPLDDIKVSIRSGNKALHSVLDDLTEKTGYYFTFDSRLIDSQKETSIVLKEMTLREALDSLLNNPKLDYRLINNNIVILPRTEIRRVTSNDSAKQIVFREIYGRVTDSKNGKGLAYATIGVKGTHFGTITNMNGDFVLHLADTVQQPILEISFIGYRNYYMPVSIDSEELLEINMTKRYISLQEVIIRYQDPVELIKESVKRIHSNYMDKPAGVMSYYRERVQKDDKYLIFSEAVVEINKASYKFAYVPERTKIIKGRKITNVDLSDTILLKIKSGISSMLELDIAHNLPDFLSEDFIYRYDYSFDNVVSYADKLVYVIRFSPKDGMSETLFRGKLFLDRESLAIIAADFEYDPAKIGKKSNTFVARKSRRLNVRTTGANYHVEYKQSEEGYHLNQVHGEVSFKMRRKRQWIASKYTIKLEMAVTNINPGNPPKIRLNEKTKADIVMSDQEFSYDPEFWGVYNTIAPEITLQEALEKIEKSIQEISE